jgi:CheY-like chemotaxis protein
MLKKKAVLLIDDDKDIQEVIKMALEQTDIQSVCCGSGMEALDVAKEQRFPVIVTDYRMPGMTGVELTALLRTRHPDSFIIGLSGENREKDFLNAGADAFFIKSFPFGDMIPLIRKKAAL